MSAVNPNPSSNTTSPSQVLQRRVLIAPASFKGSIHAVSVAGVVADFLKTHFPNVDLTLDICPVADGGTDTLEILQKNDLGFLERTLTVCGPVPGQTVEARYLVHPRNRSVVIEAAEAHGIHYLSLKELQPLGSTSYGVGQLMADALGWIYDQQEEEAQLPQLQAPLPWTLMVSLGGSASTDGGVGALQALGYRFFDGDNHRLETPITGGDLIRIGRVESPDSPIPGDGIRLQVVTDVFNPLLGEKGAAPVFAPQKGASAHEVDLLETGLAHWSRVVARDLAMEKAHFAGAGAAGGLGYGLSLLESARIFSGANWMAQLLGLTQRIEDSHIVITGEGRLDETTFMGKLTGEMIRLSTHRPVLILCGQRDDQVALPSNNHILPLVHEAMPVEQAMEQPQVAIAQALERALPILSGLLYD